MIVVLIDNGHGVNTKGKHSPGDVPGNNGKFYEYAYARDIAQEVVATLKLHGVDTRLVTPELADIPLGERANRVNAVCDQVGTKNVCLVSIHVNAAGSDGKWHSATGWEAWTSKGQTQGDKLADCFYAVASRMLPPFFPGAPEKKIIRADYSDGDPDKEEQFTILKRSKCAAVLTENFFQDNLDNCIWLLSRAGRQAIVDLHVAAILEYINQE